MKSRYLCERCKVKNCSGYVESSTNPLETFHFCRKFVFDDGTQFSQADRIRNMSDEELAKALVEIDEDYICHTFCKNICRLRDNNCPVAVKNEDCPISTEDCISGWLKSEVIQ